MKQLMLPMFHNNQIGPEQAQKNDEKNLKASFYYLPLQI